MMLSGRKMHITVRNWSVSSRFVCIQNVGQNKLFETTTVDNKKKETEHKNER